MENKKKKVELIIKTNKHNEIFDYKSKPNDIKEVTCRIKSCYILRDSNNEIDKSDQNIVTDIENVVILFRIRESFINNNFEIINPIRINMQKNEKNINNLDYNSWYVIKSCDNFYDNYNEDYNLNENDIIKLANKKYEIIKKNININNSEQEKELNKKYNISNINKKVGPIFDINLNSCQYIDLNSLDAIRNQN